MPHQALPHIPDLFFYGFLIGYVSCFVAFKFGEWIGEYPEDDI